MNTVNRSIDDIIQQNQDYYREVIKGGKMNYWEERRSELKLAGVRKYHAYEIIIDIIIRQEREMLKEARKYCQIDIYDSFDEYFDIAESWEDKLICEMWGKSVQDISEIVKREIKEFAKDAANPYTGGYDVIREFEKRGIK